MTWSVLPLLGCETFEQLLKAFQLCRGMLGEILSAFEFLDSECMRLLKTHLKLSNPISGTHVHIGQHGSIQRKHLSVSLLCRLPLLHRYRNIWIWSKSRHAEASQLSRGSDDVVVSYWWYCGNGGVKNKGNLIFSAVKLLGLAPLLAR